eukprot:TRINITY_DN20889_c0_g2_i2.p1 TRINITY_DN20889_c0_g2~~TRINITY_DN20889_c0_g2_i2.p1  ORF type:complete len:190 (+),score=37.29 TRINITY_DN20889_c0_g2_i2:114-683(+)
MLRSLVGSEMCIRDRYQRRVRGCHSEAMEEGVPDSSIRIRTDAGSYHPGSQVTGTVYVIADSPIACQALQVRALGEECIDWVELEPARQEDGAEGEGAEHEASAVLFDERIDLAGQIVDARIPVGRWAYRWSYTLPGALPSSTLLDTEPQPGESDRFLRVRACVRYTFTVSCISAVSYTHLTLPTKRIV